MSLNAEMFKLLELSYEIIYQIKLFIYIKTRSYRTSGGDLMNFESYSICNPYDSRHILLKIILRIIQLFVKKLFLSNQTLCSQNPNIWKTRHTIMSILRLLFYGATHTRPERQLFQSRLEGFLLLKNLQ